MKKKRFISILLLSVAALIAQNVSAFVIQAGNDYTIVIPKKATLPVNYAAKELQKFMEEATGITMPIVQEDAVETESAFHVGPTHQSSLVISQEVLNKLSPDGVFIKTDGSSVFLRGNNDRGEIYSVYVFLEKYLNVRFLAEDCNVVPKIKTLDLPGIDYAYAPPFYYREIYSARSFPREVSLRHRLNGWSNSLDTTVGGRMEFSRPHVHSFYTWVSPKQYFADHPEYFSLKDGKRIKDINQGGQLCLSNPDVLKITIANVLKYIKENPSVKIIDVSQEDSGGKNSGCQCEACQKIVREEDSEAGPILRFVNAVADELAKQYPDKQVETLAYNYSTTPPSLTKPRKNVIIRLCHRGCYFHGLACKQKNITMELNYETKDRRISDIKASTCDDLAGWSKITPNIFMWHYTTNFTNYQSPNQNLKALPEDIRYYAEKNVKGLFAECDPYLGEDMAPLKVYLISQLLWDPTRDPAVIKKEFCEGYYGSATNEVCDFIQLLDSQPSLHPDLHVFAYWDPQNAVTPSFCREALSLLNKARTKVAHDPVLSNRVDMLLFSYWYMQVAYPERYGLKTSEAGTLIKRMTDVVQKNHIRRSGMAPNNMMDWLKARELHFTPATKVK